MGGGGREHALAWKLSQSPMLDTLFCAPGNPGISAEPRVTSVADLDIESNAEVSQPLSLPSSLMHTLDIHSHAEVCPALPVYLKAA